MVEFLHQYVQEEAMEFGWIKEAMEFTNPS